MGFPISPCTHNAANPSHASGPHPGPRSPVSYLGGARVGALRAGRFKPGRSASLLPATREGEAR
jgi:hypothetical protein